jgi:anti-sigma regulatory factor (Ser/Thr protein kinase)
VKGYESILATDTRDLSGIRRQLSEWLDGEGMPEPPLEGVVLATHEAIVNSLQHSGGAGAVEVRANRRRDAIVVEVVDHGHWKPEGPGSDERGRGIALMRALVTNVEIIGGAQGTTVRLSEPLV